MPSQWGLQYFALLGGTQLQAVLPHFFWLAIDSSFDHPHNAELDSAERIGQAGLGTPEFDARNRSWERPINTAGQTPMLPNQPFAMTNLRIQTG
jgi:hypothetical protein